jgi:hypothetical protein
MSGINFESLFDIDNIGDLVSDGIGAFKKTISNLFDGDGFGGIDTFKAVVISNPVLISQEEASALGYVNDDSSATRDYKKFKVRIVEKTGNPHAVLADPCDISTSGGEENCLQNALVAAHTTIVTRDHKGVMIGSYVNIRLDKNANKTYNTQTGHFLEKLSDNRTGHTVLSAEACEELKYIVENGKPHDPPPTISIPSKIREWAEFYDEFDGIPNKAQHRPFLYGNEGKAVNPPFDMWFKAFIAKIYIDHLEDYAVHIESGFRSVEKQEELHQEYKARKAAHPNDKSEWPPIAACGVCSRHIGGSAIDINLMVDGVYKYKMKTPYEEWLATKIPQMAKEEIGLIWGGDFKRPGSYDPVHFELVPFAGASEFFKENAGERQVYDTRNEGRTNKEADRDRQLMEGSETSETDNRDIVDDLNSRMGETDPEEYASNESVRD